MLTTLSYAFRQLTSRPGFSAVVLLTLGLTVGAASTVFSLFDAVLLRPFPYQEPDGLVRVRTYQTQSTATPRDASSVYDFWDLKDQNRSFTDMAEYASFSSNLTGNGPAQAVRITFATPELFTLLGVQPSLGRLYTAKDDVINGDVRQVVLSYKLWQQLFGGRQDALQKVLHLRGQSYHVVAVMPKGFTYPNGTELWVPLMARYTAYTDQFWKRRDFRPHAVLARLKPGITVAQARSDVGKISEWLALHFPDTDRTARATAVSFRDAESGELRPFVALVSGAVLVLLLIGCVNVANLFIARASAREREFAIRAALGSTLKNLIGQLLAESFLYGLLGGALGVLLSWVGIHGLTALIPVELPDWMVLHLDSHVFLFALVISLLTAVLFGLAPLAQHWRPDLNEVLKQGSKGSSGGNSFMSSLRRGLVVAEVALSFILLAGAALMLRSFGNLMKVDSGIKTERLIAAQIGRYLPNANKGQQVAGYGREFWRVRERLAAIPGIAAVSAAANIPYFNTPEERSATELYTRQRPTLDMAYRAPTQIADVMPGYFAVMGIPLLDGRDFTNADTPDRMPVVIINKFAAETLFPGHSAVGEQIRVGGNPVADPWVTVVGVVGNAKWNPAERRPGVDTYWSYLQYPGPQMHLVARTTMPPAGLLTIVRRTVQEVNPDIAVIQVKTMQTIVDESVWQRRLWGFVLSAFAALALILASLGLYGVMSYLVAQRTRELGIRMAIGAKPGSVLALVLRGGMRLVAAGVVLGLVGAVASGRLLTKLLFGVNSVDMITYTTVPLLLAGVACFACLIPAWRASRIDPLITLRDE